MGTTPSQIDRIGFWNARGLNKPHKQKEMNLLMNNQKVGLFSLLETKIKRGKAQQASLNLCNGWSFNTNPAQHPGRKIWIVWKPLVYDVNIVNITEQLVHCIVQHRGTKRQLNIILIYRFNDQSMKR